MTEFAAFVPPKEKKAYLVADYIEWLCLCSRDGAISMAEAIARVYRPQTDEAEDWDEEEGYSEDVEEQGDIADEDIAEEEIPSGSEINDKQRVAGADWFGLLKYRQAAFHDFYPFRVEGQSLSRMSTLTNKHLLYLYLLLCSNLRFVTNGTNAITSDFERLCEEALKAYLPQFVVHHFGKSGVSRGDYPGDLCAAIRKLADNLREKAIVCEEDFGGKSTGDGGVDLVAWRCPIEGERLSGRLICFAQCACSRHEWRHKQAESHPINWKNRIQFDHDPANLMFIPFCFRRNDGSWFARDYIQDSILMDRLRICHLLEEADIPSLGSFAFVERAAAFQEPA